MRSFVKNQLCCLLAALMLLDPNLLQVRFAAAQQANRLGRPPAPDAKERERQAQEMQRRFVALEAARKEIPRDSFDAQSVVAKVGGDPKKLFGWVRDQTYWVPYQGALRGPTGVLMDRLGSSLDRALLLAELLRVAGHEARLAGGTLTEEQAKNLFDKVRPAPKDVSAVDPGKARQASLEMIERYAREHQLDGEDLKNSLETAWRNADKTAEASARRLADQAPRIAQAIGKSPAAGKRADQAAAFAALRNHWWVQWRQGDEWLNFDPLLPAAAPGQAAAQATTTLTPFGKDGKLTLDKKLCHEVTVRVVVEQMKDGRLKEHTVLEHALQPWNCFHDRIALQHYPRDWPVKDLSIFRPDQHARLTKKVLEGSEWLPILSVGKNHLTQGSFTAAGDIHQQAAKRFRSGLDAAIGGFDPFKRLSKPDAEAKPAAQLTAEWIEYEIHAPGRPGRKIRRQIFDLVGPAARAAGKPATLSAEQRLERGLSLLGETEILVLPCRLSMNFVDSLVTSRMLANRKVFPELLRLGEQAKDQELLDLFSKFTPLPGALHALALVRSEMNPGRGDVYLDRPNILSRHLRLQPGKKGSIVLEQGLDIVANEVAVRPSSTVDPFQARLQQGVLDTNLEALLLAGEGAVNNTAELFAEAGSAGGWIVVRSAEDPAWQKAQLSSDVRARVEADLKAGYVALVPGRENARGGAKAGWWRVDPRTGDILGMGERGWGSAEEFSLVEVFIIASLIVVVLAFVVDHFTGAVRNQLWNSVRQYFGLNASNVGSSPRGR
jgi:hypothetical protein